MAIVLVVLVLSIIPFTTTSHYSENANSFYQSQDLALVSFYRNDSTDTTTDPLSIPSGQKDQFCSPVLALNGQDLVVSYNQAVCAPHE